MVINTSMDSLETHGRATIVDQHADLRGFDEDTGVASDPQPGAADRYAANRHAASLPARHTALDGLRVVDLSRMIAGGVAGMLLADFGADVIKVEQPRSGDPLRQWTFEGEPLWWKVYARNKRFVTLNLKALESRELLRRLVSRTDVLIESFVPGTLEAWGLGWDVLHAWNPGLVLLRVSGWGQSGPSSRLPGFGTLVEAASGFAAMNGKPSGGPILPSFPLADMASALLGVNAIMFGLYHRDRHHGAGQCIDLSLFESLFPLLGPLPAEYARFGRVRTREGSRSRNAGPRGCYQTADGRWIAVSGSTPAMAERFLRGYGLSALLDDERFATNEARVQHAEQLDAEIRRAVAARTLDENLAIIASHTLTAVPVQTIADVEADPHWRARQLLADVPEAAAARRSSPDSDHESSTVSRPDTVRMHNVVPRFSDTPGELRWAGGDLGQDNHAIYVDELGFTPGDLAAWADRGVI